MRYGSETGYIAKTITCQPFFLPYIQKMPLTIAVPKQLLIGEKMHFCFMNRIFEM